MNPRFKHKERHECALTGKGIRYWEVIPEVFRTTGNDPCPYRGDHYQLMRNCVVAYEYARCHRLHPAFALIYQPSFAMEAFVSGPGWSGFRKTLKTGKVGVADFSFHQILDFMREALRLSRSSNVKISELVRHVANKAASDESVQSQVKQ